MASQLLVDADGTLPLRSTGVRLFVAVAHTEGWGVE
jgi:hypothetical protein